MQIFKERYFKAIYYLSIIFVIYFLYNGGYFEQTVSFDNYYLLILSIFTLTGAFFLESYVLKLVSSSVGFEISFKNAFISYSKTIFSKYIPGKVLLFYSVSYYLHKFGADKKLSGFIILLFQLISVWTGVIVGGYFLLYYDELNFWLRLNALFFTVAFPLIALLLPKKGIIKKFYDKLSVFSIDKKKILYSGLMLFILWIANGIGFIFFLGSFGYTLSISVLFIVGFSRTVGTLAFITPGGLGVREGLMTGLLVFIGFEVSEAVTVSVMSRLWFIVAEGLYFIFGNLIDRKNYF